MADYNFKKISATEIIEETTETTNVLVEDNGSIKRVSTSQIGKVKTVNGAEADENGDVTIELPEQVQTDLTQNDETAPDYVKGRTHWSEFEYGKLLEIEAMETNNMGYTGYYQSNELYPLQLSEGLEYEVIIDDVSFTTTCFLTNMYGYEVPCLGNPYILNYYGNDYEDNGLPFAIYLAEFNTVQICINDWNPVHIVINGFTETVHQINKKYLPTITTNDLPVSVVDVYHDEYSERGIVYANHIYRDDDGNVTSCDYRIYSVKNVFGGDPVNTVAFTFNNSSFEGGSCNKSYSELYTEFGGSGLTLIARCSWYYSEPLYSYKAYRYEDVTIPTNDAKRKSIKFCFVYSQNNVFKKLTITLYSDDTIETLIEDAHPKAAPVADATGETPTAAEFNALLASLRTAGLLNTTE